MAEGSDPLFVNWRTGVPEQISTAGIADGAVTTAKLADGAVTTIKIANNAVDNTKLAQMAQALIKGRASGAGTGDPQDLTAAQVLAILGISAGITSVNIQSFEATGAGTYTPTSGMQFCIVIATGGGGGGGGVDSDGSSTAAGAGGGAGATGISLITAASIGVSQSINVGPGGAGGVNTGGNGSNGTDTTFGSFITAGGGLGGTGIAATVSGSNYTVAVLGGVATGGLININGGPSGPGVSHGGGANITSCISGEGGSSFWGGGAYRQALDAATAAVNGITALVKGAGGSGAVNVNTTAGVTGGDGALGYIMVIEFIG